LPNPILKPDVIPKSENFPMDGVFKKEFLFNPNQKYQTETGTYPVRNLFIIMGL
jgi:hypothetical protein